MNNLEEIIAPYVISENTLIVDNVAHRYLIVRPQFGEDNNAPRIFTIFKDGVLAVSSEYPAAYRELGLIHELIEEDYGHLSEEKCLYALKIELFMAKDENFNFRAYLSFRLKFFADMIKFYSECVSNGDDENITRRDRMQLSADHLATLIGGM